jgi:hypothetical protein
LARRGLYGVLPPSRSPRRLLLRSTSFLSLFLTPRCESSVPNRALCAKQRWGDAPVHTIAAALFAGVDRIHFFREIGYQHYEYTHCPTDDNWTRGRCTCDRASNLGMRLTDRSQSSLISFVRLLVRVVRAKMGAGRRPIITATMLLTTRRDATFETESPGPGRSRPFVPGSL